MGAIKTRKGFRLRNTVIKLSEDIINQNRPVIVVVKNNVIVVAGLGFNYRASYIEHSVASSQEQIYKVLVGVGCSQ